VEHAAESRRLSEPDAALLGRAALGDGAAFETFLERHQAAAYRLVRAIAATPADAEDALQETFLACWRSAGTFAGGASARQWVLAIARNAARRLYRRKRGEPADFVSLDDLGREAGWGAPAAATDWRGREDARETIEAALTTLSAEEREVLILRDLEGLSGEETARVLQLTLPAAKSRLHRARLRLAAALRSDADA
jgi:RNA polymerase sigma-70 factor, ECF subfamily